MMLMSEFTRLGRCHQYSIRLSISIITQSLAMSCKPILQLFASLNLLPGSLYIAYAITNFVFWPLPLLHGRKPYVLGALSLLLPLQMPQAIAVTSSRSPYVATYRVALLLGRAASGIAMGLINMNLKATLLDLFGASLQSKTPHQEMVLQDDVRRHGGGLGLWLSIWTWCFVGSLGVGFLIGAAIIESLNPSWGFWIVVIIAAFVLLLNVIAPEVRRSPHRRSVAQVIRDAEVSRRVARGEVMLHLKQTGPIWWHEEVWAGILLSCRMLKQAGFNVLVLYVGWIYGQMVMIIVVSLICLLYNLGPFC